MLEPTQTATELSQLDEDEAPLGQRSTSTLGVGAKLGRYVLRRRIGAGAMGVVHAALDPELGREIALKLLHESREASELSRTRFMREAQALAKLGHPNVVSIHDVGVHGGRPFIAMEFVDGPTLRTWMEDELAQGRPRPWRELLEVFVSAGEGLACVHAAGLVHRDFKPDNVMMGADGRVRVMDFGLARDHGGQAQAEELGTLDDVDSSSVDAQTGLTRAGAVVGTPAYMAPEQLQGAKVDARSDQFSFCVALYEGLYGARPFPATPAAARLEAVRAGASLFPQGARARVPSWLRRVVQRGLHAEPSARWPSMGELLAELRRGLRRRTRGRQLALALSLATLVGAAGFGSSRVRSICSGAPEQLVGVWDEERAGQAEAALMATGLPYASQTVLALRERLDAYAQRWSTAHTQVCTATNLRREQSAALMDLRMACLESRRQALAGLGARLVEADASVAQNAVVLASSLPSIEVCLEIEAGDEAFALPKDPAALARVEGLREQLEQARSRELSADYGRGLEQAESAQAEAEALEHAYLQVQAWTRVGSLLSRMGREAEGAALLERAYLRATELGAPRAALPALTRLIAVVGLQLDQRGEALVWARQALALARREQGSRSASQRQLDEGRVQLALGRVLTDEADYARAVETLERAHELHLEALGPEHIELANVLDELGRVHVRQDDYAPGREYLERSLKLREDILGPDHPQVAESLAKLARIHLDKAEFDDAREIYGRALEIVEASLGPEHPRAAKLIQLLGEVEGTLGDHERSLAMAQRSLEILRQHYGEQEHSAVADSLLRVSADELQLGRLEQAREHAAQALEIYEASSGPEHPDVGRALDHLVKALLVQGKLEQARPLAERCLAIFEATYGRENSRTRDALHTLGRVLVGGGEQRELGIEYLRESLALAEAHGAKARGLAIYYRALGNALLEEGQLEAALAAFEPSLEHTRAAFGPKHPQVAMAMHNLAVVYDEQGEGERALELQEEVLAMFQATVSPDDPMLAIAYLTVGDLRLEQADRPGARAALERSVELWEAKFGPEFPNLAYPLISLATLELDEGHEAAAAERCARALPLMERSGESEDLAQAQQLCARAGG